MNNLVIKPMQWAKLADLHDVPPISSDDLECMKDVRAALEKHNKLGRFALHLIHKHFDIADDEILVEYNDAKDREQFFKVEKRNSEVMQHAIPTTWTLENNEPMVNCICAIRQGHHMARHEAN